MSALRRASCRPGTTALVGFGYRRLYVMGAWIGLAPVPGESAGFALDLDQVLAGLPRRARSVEPCYPWPHMRRVRGGWPRTPFPVPSAARIWLRGKGRRR